jgi:hypothetical protein
MKNKNMLSEKERQKGKEINSDNDSIHKVVSVQRATDRCRK